MRVLSFAAPAAGALPLRATLSLLLLLAPCAAHTDVAVAQWTRAELTLTADKVYDMPLFSCDVNATFTLLGSNPPLRIIRGAFWDGGATWRVRFAGPRQGVWQWTVSCGGSISGDSLCDSRGTVTVTAYNGANPLFIHGFPRVRADGRRFEFADGTPLRWLGDTAWMAADLYREDSCNAPAAANCTSSMAAILDDRVSKGFTVFQTYFYGATGTWWNDPGAWTAHNGSKILGSAGTSSMGQWTTLNATAFSARLDPLLDAVGERGLLIALGIGLHVMSVEMPPAALRALGTYTAARYGAHPLVWITAQEVNAPNANVSAWELAAERLANLGGYGAPTTAHMWPFLNASDHVEPYIYGDRSWHAWYATQGGHTGMGIRTKAHYESYWSWRSPFTGMPQPFLEAEAMYENITCGPRFAWANDTRAAAWKSVLCGSLGFTYGGAALWLFKWNAADPTGNAYNPNTWWYPNLALPGSSQVALMSSALAVRGWDVALEPRFTNTSWGVFDDDEETVLATVDGNRVYIVYAYGPGVTIGCLGSMDVRATYVAHWFNPRTGEVTPAAPAASPKADGTWCAPQKPAVAVTREESDWALFVEREARGVGVR